MLRVRGRRTDVELWGVLLGGLLAILGGWLAGRDRQREAERERLEQFRRDATAAAVAAFDVIQRARPDAVSLFSTKETIQKRLTQLAAADNDASRQLMAVSIGRTGGHNADAAAEAADELRRQLRVTVSRTFMHGRQTIERKSQPGDFDQALAANEKAREALKRFEAKIKDLDRRKRRLLQRRAGESPDDGHAA